MDDDVLSGHRNAANAAWRSVVQVGQPHLSHCRKSLPLNPPPRHEQESKTIFNKNNTFHLQRCPVPSLYEPTIVCLNTIDYSQNCRSSIHPREWRYLHDVSSRSFSTLCDISLLTVEFATILQKPAFYERLISLPF